ncbi:hypothetical protein JYU34_019447 [Plutella xylostella]|uniref:Uncharacterized protein n=1 Tax=Plutella xylostella TaxID=51655 RepID=A0ABQ7PWT4_PLUXY|nr:hypothetical protein JYU34_019447 [Plutella xylostella]
MYHNAYGTTKPIDQAIRAGRRRLHPRHGHGGDMNHRVRCGGRAAASGSRRSGEFQP